jgi:hypothetical protein
VGSVSDSLAALRAAGLADAPKDVTTLATARLVLGVAVGRRDQGGHDNARHHTDCHHECSKRGLFDTQFVLNQGNCGRCDDRVEQNIDPDANKDGEEDASHSGIVAAGSSGASVAVKWAELASAGPVLGQCAGRIAAFEVRCLRIVLIRALVFWLHRPRGETQTSLMKRIKPIKPLELRLVIEVEPYHWSDRWPDVWPWREQSEERDAYLAQCMADADIEGIRPLVPGSSFVDAFDVVRNELILRMIREFLEHIGLPGFPDREGREDTGSGDTVSSLDGGYAVLARDGEVFEPECCCAFADLEK